ncbi:MAG: FecR family protein [Myxococcales bacterium]|nr:FecR family protein [Myxococcales bacterium]MDD9971316.1 FecR family protein [Myxococcales bacterium]
MPEPAPELRALLARTRADWDEARTERTLRGLPGRRGRRTRRRLGAGLTAVAIVTGAALLTDRNADTGPRATVLDTLAVEGRSRDPGAQGAERVLHLRDGSRVVMLEPDTEVFVDESADARVRLRLLGGRARFDVAEQPADEFQVRVGDITVAVLGTVFEVERVANRARVLVKRGRVAVRWPGGSRTLSAQEGGMFPPGGAGNERGAGGVERLADSRRSGNSKPGARRAHDPVHDWREHAERGDFPRAYALLQHPNTRVGKSVSELMLAADAARLSGHPSQAVPFLQRVMESHPDDARAPLAAFTLGSVLMHELGQPREAAAAYGQAHRTTRSKALAQDALARQVEAASRAGDSPLARRLARRYLREYPKGRRINAVRRFGDL